MLPKVRRDRVISIGDIFVGILHQNLKCVEVIAQDALPYIRKDGFYSNVPIKYDITDEQFSTLLKDNPLVIIRYKNLTSSEANKFNEFSICGKTFSTPAKYENVQVQTREVLNKPASVSVSESPNPRCDSEYISFTTDPGKDVGYFRNIQTSPRLKRFGLSAHSSVTDVPEGVAFIPSLPKRPLLGFGADKSLKSLFLEEPKCDIEFLREQLQTAIQLEWSTIPLYLTAYYSIMPSQNQDIGSIIDKVFIQEMLHFAQAANILIAVGGVPVINASTAPSYPTTGLPGNVLEGLYVPLTKLTIEQTFHTFMGVEVPNNSSAVDPPLINTFFTIGAFYSEVMSCIEELGDTVFDNPSGDQVVYDFYSAGTLYKVTNVSTAKLAINQIVSQGEGETPVSPDQIGSEGYAHFYSFEEVVCGKKMVKKDEFYYAYQGEPVPYDADGVHNMIDNPTAQTIKPGTECYDAAKAFNDGYVTLVEKLEHAFKEVSSSTMNDAVYEMYSLASLAGDVFGVEYEPGSQFTCGLVWNMDFA